MRLLHLSTFLQGGAGRIITALAIAQRRAGHQVTVVADAGGDAEYQTYPEYVARLHEAQVPFLTVNSTFKRDLALNLRAVAALGAAADVRDVNLIHAHASVPSIVARLALPSVPVVQTMHGWGVRKCADHAETDVTVMNLVEALVTPSTAAANGLGAIGVTRGIDVVPYGIAADSTSSDIDDHDRALFRTVRQRGAKIAICIGTIGARKNQRLLIDSLGAWEAVFIGDGSTEELVSHARQAGVAHRVHVLGYRRDPSRYLRHADVFVLPSRNEGLPISVLEAFREGTPVLASDLPEFKEVIAHGCTGFLFEAESAASLRDALASVLALPSSTRAGVARAARKAFETRYTHERMVDDYARLYARISASAANRACSVAAQHAS
jgi:glycosyltransferase involved in cell wall biosynthesis